MYNEPTIPMKNRIDQVLAIVEKAGDALRKIYKNPDYSIEIKPDATPVTEADKISNEILCEGFKAIFPEIPLISEEANIPEYSVRRKWKYYWLIDPLDGTKEFISKNGRFCINIALIYKDRPVFGLIYNILDNEIIWAIKYDKCYIKKDGVVSEMLSEEIDNPKLRIVVSRFHMTESEFAYIDFLQARKYIPELIPLGASAKQCEIAKGSADVFPKFGRCYEWDTAAGQIIIETTGGMVVNLNTFAAPEYNKEQMQNPPLLMFNSKITKQIKSDKQLYNLFIHTKK